VADLRNQVAQAEAQTSDMGLIGTTLTAENCRGSQPVRPDQLPQPTRVDNREGETSATSDEVPMAGATFGGGREEAWADETPSAGARSTGAAAFGPVVKIDGGRAEAVAEVIDGAARQAHATVDMNLDIAGIVQLRGMRWEALHRTGADPKAAATFDPGTASALGAPLPVESTQELQAAVNEALAPSGITVSFPRVQRFEEPADVVRMTPMRIVLKDSPAGKATIGPALNLTRKQREQLFVELASVICDAAGVLLVGDIAVSIASGTGFLAIEVGGAEATTGDLVLGNPFGPPVAPDGPLADVTLPGELAGGAGPGGPALTAPPAAGGRDGASTTDSRPVASIGPLESLCETIHPSADTSCSEGALLPLGIIGLAATVGVGALDHRRQRSRLAGTPVAAVEA
jgi:hypothetical protein